MTTENLPNPRTKKADQILALGTGKIGDRIHTGEQERCQAVELGLGTRLSVDVDEDVARDAEMLRPVDEDGLALHMPALPLIDLEEEGGEVERHRVSVCIDAAGNRLICPFGTLAEALEELRRGRLIAAEEVCKPRIGKAARVALAPVGTSLALPCIVLDHML